jgi:UDP-N-acetylglucosamine 2-epimerase (non-hydrolysing)
VSRMRVMTVVGTRPEIIRLSRVIALLDTHTEHVLVHTGQNFDHELNQIFFQELEIRQPKHYLDAAGDNAMATTANVIVKADAVLEAERPDALLVLGDTNSCLAALPAKRRQVPVFHMEAGNRCFDQRVPEEINRKIVDHIADINLAYTEHARRYLIAEGIRPETILKTGSPLREVLTYYRPKIDASAALRQFEVNERGYFLVSAHREENIEDPENFRDLLATLNAAAREWKLPVLVSTHPRTRQKLESARVTMDPLVRFSRPLGLLDYCKLQLHARCVLSDSGSITEESAILGFPAVTIRQAHERPEGMDAGVLIMCGLKPADVLQAVAVVTREGRPAPAVPDYDSAAVSDKVLHAILSYTDYVNRTVWHKRGETTSSAPKVTSKQTVG